MESNKYYNTVHGTEIVLKLLNFAVSQAIPI